VAKSFFRASDQRPWAIEAPARFTTASAPTAAPPKSPVSGSQDTSKAPAVLAAAFEPGRTRRQTVWPSRANAPTKAVPTNPVAPVTRIFIPTSFALLEL